MVLPLLCAFLVLTFTALSGIHFYWLFGGKWGTDRVLPSKPGEAPPAFPHAWATLAVALGLLLLAGFYVLFALQQTYRLPHWLFLTALFGIPALFLLRMIGDFKYVGLFKRVKDTAFARADSQVLALRYLQVWWDGWWDTPSSADGEIGPSPSSTSAAPIR